MARKEPTWLSDAVFYEIYPQSFYDTNGDGIGDLDGVIAKLDYVKDLGCRAIWLNPFYESPFADAGYDISDYYRVAPRYGTNEDFARPCRVAHEKGIRVIADLVPCHTSVEHPWFRKSCEKERNEYSDTFIWCDDPNVESDRLCRITDGRKDRYYRSYYETQPAINYGFAHPTEPWQKSPDDPVCLRNKQAMLDVMDYWISLGCDGFRVDMAAFVVKDDPDGSANKRFWREVRAIFDEKYPECVLFPEWSRPLLALDAGFHFDMFLTGGSLFRREKPEIGYYNYFRKAGRGILSRFTEDYLAWLDGTLDKGYISFVTGNHDQPRISLGRDTEELKVLMA
ncbi:MAG: glycosylase, partial [Ruminococcus sp.]|nr:glycosylase [Candidatus Apopatosoma intestinale]